MGKLVRAIGLMSGTAMDGIDVALIDTDGEAIVQRGPAATFPYSPAFREQLRAGLVEAKGIVRRMDRPGRLRLLEQYLTDLHAEAVTQFLSDHQIEARSIAVIGFHGHTVVHRQETIRLDVPDDAAGSGVIELWRKVMLTIQLGDGERLAATTGIDVVYDLRANDCAHGGQGAPLVPVYHAALAAPLPQRPLAILNIGGVANVTWIGADGRLIAFDTGPGNAMIDDWMRERTGASHDPGGRMAAQGQVHESYVTEYLRQSHFAEPPPKSLDRNAFPLELVSELSTEDGAATLTAFTAASIARAREHMPEEPQLWVVAGGGRLNRTLMSMVAARVENAVVPAEAVGLNGDHLEAEAWAYLAVRSRAGLPISFPGTTGVPQPTSGGLLARAPG